MSPADIVCCLFWCQAGCCMHCVRFCDRSSHWWLISPQSTSSRSQLAGAFRSRSRQAVVATVARAILHPAWQSLTLPVSTSYGVDVGLEKPNRARVIYGWFSLAHRDINLLPRVLIINILLRLRMSAYAYAYVNTYALVKTNHKQALPI